MARYDGGMTPERSLPEPSEFVIWATSALLALVVGLGAAFFIWMLLRRSGAPLLAEGAVVSLGVGVALIGLSSERTLGRVFLVLLAVMLIVGYVLGGPEFARLLP
jgi:hypothetical protein